MMSVKSYLIAIAALPLAACVGNIGDGAGAGSPGSRPSPGNPGGGPEPGPGSNGGMQPPVLIPPGPGQTGGCQEAPPPVQPTRRMTRDQYLATVRDLLGDTRDLE